MNKKVKNKIKIIIIIINKKPFNLIKNKKIKFCKNFLKFK